jgi:hypothetical protein
MIAVKATEASPMRRAATRLMPIVPYISGSKSGEEG